MDKAFAAAVGIPHKGPGEVFTKAERIEMVRTGAFVMCGDAVCQATMSKHVK